MTELMHCDVCGDMPVSDGRIDAYEDYVRCPNCGQFERFDWWNHLVRRSLCNQERELFMRRAATDLGWSHQDIRRSVADRYAYLGERAKK